MGDVPNVNESFLFKSFAHYSPQKWTSVNTLQSEGEKLKVITVHEDTEAKKHHIYSLNPRGDRRGLRSIGYGNEIYSTTKDAEKQYKRHRLLVKDLKGDVVSHSITLGGGKYLVIAEVPEVDPGYIQGEAKHALAVKVFDISKGLPATVPVFTTTNKFYFRSDSWACQTKGLVVFKDQFYFISTDGKLIVVYLQNFEEKVLEAYDSKIIDFLIVKDRILCLLQNGEIKSGGMTVELPMDKFEKWNLLISVGGNYFICFGFERDTNKTGLAMFDRDLRLLKVTEYLFDRNISQVEVVRGRNGWYLVISCFPSVEILLLRRDGISRIAKFGPQKLDFDWACSMSVLRKDIMIGTESGRLYQIPLNDL